MCFIDNLQNESNIFQEKKAFIIQCVVDDNLNHSSKHMTNNKHSNHQMPMVNCSENQSPHPPTTNRERERERDYILLIKEAMKSIKEPWRSNQSPTSQSKEKELPKRAKVHT